MISPDVLFTFTTHTSRDRSPAYGLHVERLPRESYRVDAIIEGAVLKALIEIAKTSSEADIGWLVEVGGHLRREA